MNFKKLVDIEGLKDIYLFANTPSFLYNEMIRDKGVRALAELDARYLIKEFSKLEEKEIKTLDQLVKAYALYIAMLLQDSEKTKLFLNDVGNIEFEWFDDIRDIYWKSYKPTTTSTFTGDFTYENKNRINTKTEDNTTRIIEL